jgi:hypothetical protein
LPDPVGQAIHILFIISKRRRQQERQQQGKHSGNGTGQVAHGDSGGRESG